MVESGRDKVSLDCGTCCWVPFLSDNSVAMVKLDFRVLVLDYHGIHFEEFGTNENQGHQFVKLILRMETYLNLENGLWTFRS